MLRLSILVILLFSSNVFAEHPHQLYMQGKVGEAEAGYKAMLEDAKKSDKPQSMWQAYQAMAWFQHHIGDYEEALVNSNKAFEIASKVDDKFMIGRSLDWLGFAYASMGLYQLAIEFYQQAVEIGAPEGEVEIIAVWGLGLQELGYTYYRMGDIEGAKAALLKTYNFAKEKGIDVGVAEGGAYLSEIALAEGKLTEAMSYAKEAIKGAESAACSPLNTMRAKVTLAKAKIARLKDYPGEREATREYLRKTISEAEAARVVRYSSEAKILLARLLPEDESARRMELVQEAFEKLANTHSELRGFAEAELGRVYLKDRQDELAAFYLKHGLKVSNEMFRNVDKAFIEVGMSELWGLRDDRQTELKRLSNAVDAAKNSGQLAKALELEIKLGDELLKDGFNQLAEKRFRSALTTLEKIAPSVVDPVAKDRYIGIREDLTARIVELRAELGFFDKQF